MSGVPLETACMVVTVIVDTQLFEENLSIFQSSKQSPSGCETLLYMVLA